MNKSEKIRWYFTKYPEAAASEVAGKFNAAMSTVYRVKKQTEGAVMTDTHSEKTEVVAKETEGSTAKSLFEMMDAMEKKLDKVNEELETLLRMING